MPIKYIFTNLIRFDYELYLTLIVASCLLIASLILGRVDRCLFNADSSSDPLLTLFDVSAQNLLLDIKKGFCCVLWNLIIYLIFNLAYAIIMAYGGTEWMFNNGENVLLNHSHFIARIRAKDRSVSLTSLY